MTRSSSQAVCCQLAASTSFRAFEILCAKCEGRGLVFVHSDDPEQKLGEVYYDRDPSWQHEMVSGLLSKIVAFDLGQLAGTRNQTAWIPADLAAMEAAPSVVLEVALFNESETELLNEGSEWLHLPDVQQQQQQQALHATFHPAASVDSVPPANMLVLGRPLILSRILGVSVAGLGWATQRNSDGYGPTAVQICCSS
ncbi:TPA: hypothetical protein ACH3X3_010091 [Trebouxia sp. C0006]